MLNPHVAWRLELARRIADRLQPFPGIQAMVVAGSVARGYADAYSDLEIPIFWDELPKDELRRAIVAALGAEFLYEYDGPALEDQLLIGDFQVDLWHNRVADEEAVFKAVLQDFDTNLGNSNFIDTVRTCIPLAGAEIILGWKERAKEYPPGLAERIIREHLTSFSIRALENYARRENPAGFYSDLCFLQQEIFLVLLALNRAYFPTFKWMVPTMEGMAVKPPGVVARFTRSFRADYSQAVSDMAALLVETLELVEAHFPGLDTSPAHHRLPACAPPTKSPSSGKEQDESTRKMAKLCVFVGKSPRKHTIPPFFSPFPEGRGPGG